MLSSQLVKSTSSFVAHNSTFLNKVLGVSQTQARNFSVAFNVKSKFETAFENRQKAAKANTTHKT